VISFAVVDSLPVVFQNQICSYSCSCPDSDYWLVATLIFVFCSSSDSLLAFYFPDYFSAVVITVVFTVF